MYPVTQAYINRLKAVGIKDRRIRGTVDNIAFTEDDLLASSFAYTDMAMKSADIKLGGVFIGSLQLTFLASFESRIARGTWRGRTINASIGLLVDPANNTWEDVPLKPFIIDEANHTTTGIAVTAYDYMQKFDTAVIMTQTWGNLYGLAVLACNNCGVTLGMTEEQIQAMPNGSETLGLYNTSDIQTWRDMLSWMAVTMGGFATINRSGALEFRTWNTEPVLEIDRENRYTGGSWSDFQTNYSAITVTHMETNSPMYYAMPDDNGLTLEVGADPFVQNGLPETYNRQRRAILTAIQDLKYTPFKSTSLMDPCLDLGDVIRYTGGLASQESLGCVMRIDFQYSNGKTTLQGFGKNPAQANAKSKQDKAIAAAAAGTKDDTLTFYPYVNGSAITIETERKRIMRLNFSGNAATTVMIEHELKMRNNITGAAQTVTLEYYYDGNKIDYEPADTYSEDDRFHLMTPHTWILQVEAGTAHTWEVYAKTDAGTATINIGDLRAILWGQKLAASGEFDGLIELADEWPAFAIEQEIASITEGTVSVTLQRPSPWVSIAEYISIYDPSITLAAIQEGEVSVNLFAPKAYRITEDGQQRITEQEIDGETGNRINESSSNA